MKPEREPERDLCWGQAARLIITGLLLAGPEAEAKCDLSDELT